MKDKTGARVEIGPLENEAGEVAMGNKELAEKVIRKQKTGNYRLVSLTLVVGKILESIIKDEIAEYLKVYGKIGLSQHSFVKRRSRLTNLLELLR
eukprot:g35676.t1